MIEEYDGTRRVGDMDDQEKSEKRESAETILETICGERANPEHTIRLAPPPENPDDATRIVSPRRMGVPLETLRLTTSPEANASNREVGFLRDCTHEFSLRDLIGKGGQGEIHGASQMILGREVAIKRARNDSQAQLDFFKESFTSAQLDHPNIVPVYDLGLMDTADGSVPMLAMKRVRGTPWNQLLKEDLNSTDLARDDFLAKHLNILVLVINAICYAHSKRIIHRDLKPQQVMVGGYGEVYLLDWGLAVLLDDPRNNENLRQQDLSRYFTLQTASNPAGTPAYMAPEQAQMGTMNLGIHTDVYLLGAMLYQLLTGKPPHMAESGRKAVAKAMANLYDPIPSSAPAELAELALQCLESDPQMRPPSALTIRQGIETYLSGAGRKAESREITREILAMEKFESLAQVSEVSQRLAQAAHLWSDNPDHESARTKVLLAFARKALQSGDFLLAQLQVDRIHDEVKAEQLRGEIEEARELAARAIPFPPLFTPLRWLALIGVNILILAGFALLSLSAERALSSETGDMVRSLATLAADDIDPAEIIAVDRDRDMDAPEFKRVLQRLRFIRRSNPDVRYIYTMRPEPGAGEDTWRTLVDADPVDVDLNRNGTIDADEVGAAPGRLYDSGSPEMALAITDGVTTFGWVEDEWGKFVSGFAPIFDSATGEPLAIVGVDVTLATIENKMRRFRMICALGALLLAALITGALLAYFASLRALARVRQLEDAIKKQDAEICRKGVYLG